MARRRIPVRGGKWFERYPGLYARTGNTWNGRQGQRDTRALFNLFGLNTAMDTLHKEDGESPFLTNLRFFGEKEIVERAQIMSRRGARYVGGISNEVSSLYSGPADSFIELYEGKIIRSKISFNGKLIGLGLDIQNVDNAKGFLRISVRNSSDKEVSNGVVDLEKIGNAGYTSKQVRFMVATVDSPANVVIDILDDVDDISCEEMSPIRQRRVRIASVGNANHEWACFDNPNLDRSLKEIPPDWQDGVSAPNYRILSTDASVIPRVNRVCVGNECYSIYPVKTTDGIKLYRTKLSNGETAELDSPVWPGAKAVRGVQMNGYFWYVDGNSPLRRIDLSNWVTSLAVPNPNEIGIAYQSDITAAITELTAKRGASLILYHQNRLYLSGFKDDPNIVHFSLIDGDAPRPDQFNPTDRFYSPDDSPKDTSCDPITALASLNDNILVFRQESISVFSLAGGFEWGSPQQVSPEGVRYGVLNQEAVAYGRNLIYFFNPTEGLMRFAGSLAKVESIKVDNILQAIPDANKERVFLEYFDMKVRLYFSLDKDYNDRCLVEYTSFNKPSPWFMDINTPVNSTFGIGATDKLFALHSQYPAIFEIDAKDQFTDFGSIIEAEYHTAYITTGNPFGWEIPRRIFAMVMANTTNSYYLGIDYDWKDKPSVWRKFVSARVDEPTNENAVFKNTEQAGVKSVQATIRGFGRFYQLRIKTYCYRSQMELVALSVEGGHKLTV